MLLIDLGQNEEVVRAKVRVMGIGGGGCNAISYMFEHGFKEEPNVRTIAANTDSKALSITRADDTIELGEKKFRGLGVGGDAEKGRQALEESADRIKKFIKGADLLILVATLGGGTGTGGIPVAAKIAKEMDTLTVAVVTLPFEFEGRIRRAKADKAVKELEGVVDTLLIIEDDKLLSLTTKEIPFKEGFNLADRALFKSVKGITDTIFNVGHVNVDFADLKSILREGGKAIMGSGKGTGENALIDAVVEAVSNPLIQGGSIIGASKILANFQGKEDKISLVGVKESVDKIKELTGADRHNVEIFFGISSVRKDEKIEGDVEVTVIATSGRGVGAAEAKPDDDMLDAEKPPYLNDDSDINTPPYMKDND